MLEGRRLMDRMRMIRWVMRSWEEAVRMASRAKGVGLLYTLMMVYGAWEAARDCRHGPMALWDCQRGSRILV